MAAAPKTPVAGREEIGEMLRGARDRRQAWTATKVSSMPSKLIRPTPWQGRSARRISAPAPGSGDRREGQFALAKGKLHGLLSGAEP